MGAMEGATPAAGVTYVVQSLDWSIAGAGLLTIRSIQAAVSGQAASVASVVSGQRT